MSYSITRKPANKRAYKKFPENFSHGNYTNFYAMLNRHIKAFEKNENWENAGHLIHDLEAIQELYEYNRTLIPQSQLQSQLQLSNLELRINSLKKYEESIKQILYPFLDRLKLEEYDWNISDEELSIDEDDKNLYEDEDEIMY